MRIYQSKRFRIETKVSDGLGADVSAALLSQPDLVHYIHLSTPRAYPTDFTVKSTVVIGAGAVISYANSSSATSEWTAHLLGVDSAQPKSGTQPLLLSGQGQARLGVEEVREADGWGQETITTIQLCVDLQVT